MPDHHLTVAEGLARCPAPRASASSSCSARHAERRALRPARHRPPDAPHPRRGLRRGRRARGQFRNGGRAPPFGPGDVLFVPAGVEHRFEEFTDDLAVWVFFYGPEGGEAAAVSPGCERTLPRDYYLSPEMFAREQERIFCREWFCVGREEELAEPGRLRGEGRGGRKRARGAHPRRAASRRTTTSAVTAARGWCPSGGAGCFAGGIRCPYHSWTYTLDGELRTAPFLDEADGLARRRAVAPPGRASTAGAASSSCNLTPAEAAARGHTLRRPARARARAAAALSAGRAPGRRAGSTYEVAGQLEGHAGELQRVLPLRSGAPRAVPSGARVQAARRLRARLGAGHPAP